MSKRKAELLQNEKDFSRKVRQIDQLSADDARYYFDSVLTLLQSGEATSLNVGTVLQGVEILKNVVAGSLEELVSVKNELVMTKGELLETKQKLLEAQNDFLQYKSDILMGRLANCVERKIISKAFLGIKVDTPLKYIHVSILPDILDGRKSIGVPQLKSLDREKLKDNLQACYGKDNTHTIVFAMIRANKSMRNQVAHPPFSTMKREFKELMSQGFLDDEQLQEYRVMMDILDRL